jgi:hypothetical protein
MTTPDAPRPAANATEVLYDNPIERVLAEHGLAGHYLTRITAALAEAGIGPVKHKPIIEVDDSHVTAGCKCGWADPSFWGAIEGARLQWVRHIIETFVPDDWPWLLVEFWLTQEALLDDGREGDDR